VYISITMLLSVWILFHFLFIRENLSISPAVWWMKALCVNFLLFLLLFFLTTPSMFLNLLNVWGYQKVVQELSVSMHSSVWANHVIVVIMSDVVDLDLSDLSVMYCKLLFVNIYQFLSAEIIRQLSEWK